MKTCFNTWLVALGLAAQISSATASQCDVGQLQDGYEQLSLGNVEEVRVNTLESSILPDLSTEGGELVGYFDNANLVLMKLSLYGETGRSEQTYYLNGQAGHLIRITDYHYRVPIDVDSSAKLASIDTSTAYVRDGKLLKQSGGLITSLDEHLVLLSLLRKALDSRRKLSAE